MINMIKHKHTKALLVFLLLLITVTGLSVVCAADDDSLDSSISTQQNTIQEEVTTDISTDKLVKTENKNVKQSSYDYEGDNGTFTELESDINANDNLVLEKNYVRSSEEDVIVINKTITVDGNGYVIDTNENSGTFNITADASVTFKNMIFMGNRGDIVSIYNMGQLTFINTTFCDNNVTSGQAVLNSSGSSVVEIINSTAYDNEGIGGIFSFANTAKVLVNNSNFSYNNASNSVLRPSSSSVTFTVDNSRFTSNHASLYGGAINAQAKTLINNSYFEGNWAETKGGAIALRGGRGTVMNSIFINNKVDNDNPKNISQGGAIYSTVPMTLINNTMTNNSAFNGSAIYADSRGGFTNPTIIAEDAVAVEDDEFTIIVRVTDDSSNNVTGGNISVTIAGHTFKAFVDEGVASINVVESIDSGNYTITPEYSQLSSDGNPNITTAKLEILPSTKLNYAKVRSLIASATEGSVIVLSDSIKRSAAESNLTVNKSIVLDLNGQLIDANYGRIFIIEDNVELTVKNAVIVKVASPEESMMGSNGTLAYLYNGRLILDNVTIVNDTASNFGSVATGSLIYSSRQSEVIINNSLYENNTAALLRVYGNATIDNTCVTNNQLRTGWDERSQGVIDDCGNLTIINSLFENNTVGQSLIYATLTDYPVNVNNSSFINTDASFGNGGALQLRAGGNIDYSTFINNRVMVSSLGRNGGAIYANGNLNVNHSIFINNRATQGTIIAFNYNCRANIENCVLMPIEGYSAIINEDELNTPKVVDNNYWGINTSPQQYVESGTYWDDNDESATSSSITVNNWVVMNSTLIPSEDYHYGDRITVLTYFNQTLDANGNYAEYTDVLPDGFNVTYKSTTGILDSSIATVIGGVATNSYTILNGEFTINVTQNKAENILTGVALMPEPLNLIVSDDNFTEYFNDDGTPKDFITPNSVIHFDGQIEQRYIQLDMPLTLTTYTNQAVLRDVIIDIYNNAANTNITDLIIENENYAEASIRITNTSKILLKNNTLTQANNNSKVRAVLIRNSQYITLEDNTIKTTGVCDDIDYWNGGGLKTSSIELTNSTNCLITNNQVITNDTGSGSFAGTIEAITITASSDNNITNNTINVTSSRYAYATSLTSNAYNNLVENNTITSKGTQYACGVQITGNAKDNTITGNDIKTVAENVTYGLYISNNYDGVISDNIISFNNITAQSKSAYLVELWYAKSTQILNNSFTGANDYTLAIAGYQTTYNNITGNYMNLTGYMESDPVENDYILVETTGVKLVGNSNYNIVKDNNITVTTPLTTSNAVNLTASDYNNVTDNYLVATFNTGDVAVTTTTQTNIVRNNLPNDPKEVIITDDTYTDYFDSQSRLKVSLPPSSTIYLSGEFSDKVFIFDTPLTITSHEDQAVLVDSQIILQYGSKDSQITNLIINNTNSLDYIILVDDVSNITISNNTLTLSKDIGDAHIIVLNKTDNTLVADNNMTLTAAQQPVEFDEYNVGYVESSAVSLYNSSQNTIRNNNIKVDTTQKIDDDSLIVALDVSGKYDYGVSFEYYYSAENNIYENIIEVNADDTTTAVLLQGYTRYNNFTENNITLTTDVEEDSYTVTAYGVGNRITNNILLSGNLYGDNSVSSTADNTVQDNQPQNRYTTTITPVIPEEAYIGSQITVTAIVQDENAESVTTSTVEVRDNNDNLLGIIDLTQTTNTTITFTDEYDGDLTLIYMGDATYLTSNTTAHIRVTQPVVTLTLADVVVTNSATTLSVEAKLGDDPLTSGKVYFKVNGKVLREDNGRVLYADIMDGQAVIEDYTQTNTWNDATTVTALYTTANGEKISSNTENVQIITTPQVEDESKEPAIVLSDVSAGVTETITYTVTVENLDDANDGKVVLKINGKVVKTGDNKVYSHIEDGVATFTYTVPKTLKAGDYTIKAVYTNSNLKLEQTATLTIS